MFPQLFQTLRLCEAHMEKYCRVSFTTQSAPLDSKLEHIYRSAALQRKVRGFV